MVFYHCVNCREIFPDTEAVCPRCGSKAQARSKVAPLYTNNVGMEFVLILPGVFLMGSADDEEQAFYWEQPRHEVTISKPFYLAKYPVTQGQWQNILGSNPSFFTGKNHPVETVSRNETQEIIRSLNGWKGRSCYRLPTEAEWEYAARAGSSASWPFLAGGADLGAYAWYQKNSGGATQPVGQKAPNAWGLYDMLGNVWEWVQDWYGAYEDGAVSNPLGPSTGELRVLRGGSWNDEPRHCRPGHRNISRPDFKNSHIGFRLALDLEPLL